MSGPLLFLLGVAAWQPAGAEVAQAQEYMKRLKMAQTIQPVGETPFGEQLNMYTGEVSFKIVDVQLEGIGPTIALTRTFGSSQEAPLSIYRPTNMGGWVLSIPRIETLAGIPNAATGPISSPGTLWAAPGSDPLARCTQFGMPQGNPAMMSTWWTGMTLYTEAGDGQPMLKRAAQNTAQPTMTGQGGAPIVFPAVTQQNWQVGCLPSTTNGQPGEAFLAVSPDGTRYYLTHLHGDPAESMYEDTLGGVRVKQHRMAAVMYVSKVEDRFGNYIEYHYDSSDRLTGITSPDGRSVQIQWRSDVPVIHSITVQAADAPVRVWQYEYAVTAPDQARLTAVVLPDASRWTYTLLQGSGPWQFSYDPAYATIFPRCDTRTLVNKTEELSVDITHPSGVRGRFWTRPSWHARSYVPSLCVEPTGLQEFEPYEGEPTLFGTYTLTKKELSGPGIPTSLWQYRYTDAQGSTKRDGCATGDLCPSAVWTDVVEPDGNRARYTHSNRWGETEGKLLSIQRFTADADTQPIQTQTMAYAASTDGPYPSKIGDSLVPGGNEAKGNTYTPLKQQVTTQQGTTFTATTPMGTAGFDGFGRAKVVTRSSSLGMSRTDSTTYHDNTPMWVLGQVQQTACSAATDAPCAGAGIVVSSTVYDAATALPVSSSSFGALQQSMTYHANGMLATIKDANNNITSFASWKRGIPTLITFADAKTLSAVVNDLGQITSVTDATNASTCYAYDAMGRITSIAYPNGTNGACDTAQTKWLKTQASFVPVAVAEYGLPAGHWRQSVSTGAGQKITYFDALWRPVLTKELDSTNGTTETLTKRFQRFEYDAEGRTTFSSFPGSVDMLTTGTWTSYDALGRVTSVSQDSEWGPLTTLTAYDPNAFITRVTNPRLQVTTSIYQAFDRPTLEYPRGIDHPEGASTEIYRDAFGKVTALRRRNADASQDVWRRYVYQSDQRLCKTLEPETGATVMHYDAAGNLDWSAAGVQGIASTAQCNHAEALASGRAASRTYDARNRVATLSFPDGKGNAAYTYENDGLTKTVSVDNGDGTPVVTTYTYNPRRLLVGERMQWGGAADLSLGYDYNAAGQLKEQTVPGLTVAYAPNALGQPTQAGPYATGVQYYPNGAIKQFTYGNGIVHTMTQNARQLPARSTDAGGNALDMGYAYDQNGNVTATTDYATSRQSRTMTYDGLDRLLTAQSVMFGGTDNTARYTYDALDNLKTLKVNGRDYAYVYDPATQRLSSITQGLGGATVVGLSYDPQGNLANKNGRAYSFDYGNRLRSVAAIGGGPASSYVYDGMGRRIVDDTSARKFSLYSQSGQLVYEDNLREAKRTQYVYLGGSLVARVSQSTAPPTPVLTVPSYNTTGSYTASWTSVAGATGYQLEESVSGGAWVQVYSGTALSKGFSGQAAGNYGYRIRACLNAGCSNWSGTSSTAVQFAPNGAPVMSAPVTATAGNYTVSWSSVGGATAYTLEENANGAGWSVVSADAGLSRAYSNKPAGSYQYRAKACNPAGCGSYSATATVTSVHAPASAPTVTAPTTNMTGAYTVSWTSVGAATSYQLEESANGGAWSTIYTGASTSAALSGRVMATYGYRAKACNLAGCSGVSATASTQVIFPPAMPATLTGYTEIDDSLHPPLVNWFISWTASPGATYYEVQWGTSTFNVGTNTSYTTAGRGTRSFTVRACNTAGCSAWKGPLTL